MEYVIAAVSFGLVAGLKPGPLGVYVIHETISRGDKSGFVASLAPLVTDGPIILITFLLLSSIKQFDNVIAGISLVGSAYLFYLAIKLLGANQNNPSVGDSPASFLTAVKLNFLNPAPYLFWGTVGGAYLIRGSIPEAITFALVMLSTLSISKFGLAKTVKVLGNRFHPNAYTYLLKVLAVILIFFALNLGHDAYHTIQLEDYC